MFIAIITSFGLLFCGVVLGIHITKEVVVEKGKFRYNDKQYRVVDFEKWKKVNDNFYNF